MKAKKKFGQNFLKDEVILDKIIAILNEVIQAKPKNLSQENSQISQSEEFTENFSQNLKNSKSVKFTKNFSQNAVKIVEIGLGLGDLTQKLLEFSQNFNAQYKESTQSEFTQCEKTQNAKNAKSKFAHNKSGAKCGKMAVVGYEIDSDLIPILEAKFQKQLENQHLVLRCEDASLRRSLDDEPYILVANLPYYIATRLILQAFEDRNCTAILVMVQKEVALKFCAKSGESEFCALSVLAELLCERKFLFEVPPNSFTPPPNVDSAVIFLRKKQQNLGDLHAFKAFLRACFKAPRKQLLTNLRSQKGRILPVFSRRNLRENVRPHELCVDDFLEIFEIIKDSYEQDERGREKQQTLSL